MHCRRSSSSVSLLKFDSDLPFLDFVTTIFHSCFSWISEVELGHPYQIVKKKRLRLEENLLFFSFLCSN